MKKCFIMGLPKSGKTTFLAALWYVLNNPSVLSKYKIHNFTGDYSYFVNISNKWAKVEEISRSQWPSEEITNELPLINSEGKESILVLPDLHGESFQSQYVERVIKNEHAKFVKECDGIILFVKDIKESFLIVDVPEKYRKVSEGVTSTETRKRVPKDDDSTQAQLVDLLQIIAYLRNNQPLNLCIIVSAWDSLPPEIQKNGPDGLIKERLSLLWQYVEANSKIFKTIYFGLSAQGGSLEERERLLKIIEPRERIRIIDARGQESSDITLPVDWVMKDINE